MPSIFSKIIAREIPGHIVYEDDRVIAFLDIHPVHHGHTLVVPKQEKENALQSDASEIAACWFAIQKIAPAILRATGSEGCNITTNVGQASGQEIFHTHFHIIPRKTGDGLSSWPHVSASQDELAQMAEQIRRVL